MKVEGQKRYALRGRKTEKDGVLGTVEEMPIDLEEKTEMI
jgi:hypothetical protein